MMETRMNRIFYARELMYHFLSRLYMFEVDTDLWKTLEAMEVPGDCPDRDMTDGYKRIYDWVHTHTGSGDDLDILAADYARVFLSAGVAAGRAAFPYASVYMGNRHLTMQEPAGALSALYASEGLTVREDMFKVPEDHIGLIFEYMARLCALARKASPHVYLKEQQTFFESFLKPWVGTFCKMIRDCSETGFYQGLARLTEGFMALEAESLGSLQNSGAL